MCQSPIIPFSGVKSGDIYESAERLLVRNLDERGFPPVPARKVVLSVVPCDMEYDMHVVTVSGIPDYGTGVIPVSITSLCHIYHQLTIVINFVCYMGE